MSSMVVKKVLAWFGFLMSLSICLYGMVGIVFADSRAYADITLSVPAYKQEKDHWCWAAAAKMVGKYKYSAGNYTQSQIVTHVKGPLLNNVDGTVSEMVSAVKYALKKNGGSGRISRAAVFSLTAAWTAVFGHRMAFERCLYVRICWDMVLMSERFWGVPEAFAGLFTPFFLRVQSRT